MIEAVVAITAIALVCGVLLALAARYLSVPEDPRVERLTELLPGVNCGACGFAGCADMARALAAGKAEVTLCPVCSDVNRKNIAAFLGVAVEAGELKTALVMCTGSLKVAGRRFAYNGIADCAAAAATGGGDKQCAFGCLGYGSCSHACPVNAIAIADGLAVVDRARCISCGRCVTACPRRIIQLVRAAEDAHVLCSSPEKGPVVRKACQNGCIGCRLCVKLAPEAFVMKSNFLAARDYAKAMPANAEDVMTKCPGHCIRRA